MSSDPQLWGLPSWEQTCLFAFSVHCGQKCARHQQSELSPKASAALLSPDLQPSSTRALRAHGGGSTRCPRETWPCLPPGRTDSGPVWQGKSCCVAAWGTDPSSGILLCVPTHPWHTRQLQCRAVQGLQSLLPPTSEKGGASSSFGLGDSHFLKASVCHCPPGATEDARPGSHSARACGGGHQESKKTSAGRAPVRCHPPCDMALILGGTWFCVCVTILC